MLGLIVKLWILFTGIFTLFKDKEIGILLVLISVILILIEMLVDKYLFKDYLHSWKEWIGMVRRKEKEE